jgi:hypothetical protein
MSEVTVLAAGDECPYLVTSEFMPFEAQPRFSLPDDLGFYQSRGVGAVQRNDQLHTRQRRDSQRRLDKGATEAHVGHPAEGDNTSLCPQLDARIDAFALSPTMFHELSNRKCRARGPGLAVRDSASNMCACAIRPWCAKI